MKVPSELNIQTAQIITVQLRIPLSKKNSFSDQ